MAILHSLPHEPWLHLALMPLELLRAPSHKPGPGPGVGPEQNGPRTRAGARRQLIWNTTMPNLDVRATRAAEEADKFVVMMLSQVKRVPARRRP